MTTCSTEVLTRWLADNLCRLFPLALLALLDDPRPALEQQ